MKVIKENVTLNEDIPYSHLDSSTGRNSEKVRAAANQLYKMTQMHDITCDYINGKYTVQVYDPKKSRIVFWAEGSEDMLDKIIAGEAHWDKYGRKLLLSEALLNEERDFEWSHPLYAVVKDDGTYAGVPCLSEAEAWDLSGGHPGSHIFRLLDMGTDEKVEESLNEDGSADYLHMYKQVKDKVTTHLITAVDSIPMYDIMKIPGFNSDWINQYGDEQTAVDVESFIEKLADAITRDILAGYNGEV